MESDDEEEENLASQKKPRVVDHSANVSKEAIFSVYAAGSSLTTEGSLEARRKLADVDLTGGYVAIEEAMQESFPFLKDVRDINKKKPGTEGYDASTLLIAEQYFTKMTETQKQYWKIKSRFFDSIVFFQVGSFYELYAGDAKIGNELLGLKIHSRDSAGFPKSQADQWTAKFIAQGFKVVRVDQGEDNGKNKNRIITEVVTAGTVVDPQYLPGSGSVFILSLAVGPSREVSVTFADLSLLEVHVAQFSDDEDLSQLMSILDMVSPKEIVMSSSALKMKDLRRIRAALPTVIISTIPYNRWWPSHTAKDQLEQAFKAVGAAGVPSVVDQDELRVESFGGLLNYLNFLEVGRKSLMLVQANVVEYRVGSAVSLPSGNTGSMIMDAATVRNLDIFLNSSSGKPENTLWSLLKNTWSPMGERLLRKWITHPLLDVKRIKERQRAIDAISNGKLRPIEEKLNNLLRSVGDIERTVCRVHAVHGMKEMADSIKPKQFLDCIKSLQNVLNFLKQPEVCDVGLDSGSALLQRLLTMGSREMPNFANALAASTSFWESDKNGELLIKPEFATGEMQEAAQNLQKAKAAIQGLLNDAKNNVHEKCAFKINGDSYVFEVPADVSRSDIPRDWAEEKCSAKTKKRFVSRTLNDCALQLARVQEEYDRLSSSQLVTIFSKFDEFFETWRSVIFGLASLDCLQSLAAACSSFGTSCFPDFVEDNGNVPVCRLIEARHPVMERAIVLRGGSFVPNDIVMRNPVSIITGPNSGGKSTVLRTVAVSAILAQMGCKVPAQSATLSIMDRIFTRIGARDSIMQAKSTFMIEMEETSAILRNATHKSLLIVDELGRGTSTRDGYAIAWAVLYKLIELGALTLFATHFHGLASDFASMGSRVSCHSMSFISQPQERNVVFLYQFVEGAAGASFGMNVAHLAGIPDQVLDNAEKVAEQAKNADMFNTSTWMSTFREVLQAKSRQETQQVLLENGLMLK